MFSSATADFHCFNRTRTFAYLLFFETSIVSNKPKTKNNYFTAQNKFVIIDLLRSIHLYIYYIRVFEFGYNLFLNTLGP